MKILTSLLVLGLIIVIHELGHFLSARLFKIPVEEFSIGMGTEVYTYQGDKTKYSLRAIPIGGFVNIKGMEVGDETEGGFNKKSPFARFVVLFAGVFMNFLLAYVLIFGMILSQGETIISERPIVGNLVRENTELKKGDLILEIGNEKIFTWLDIRKAIEKLEEKEKPVKILLKREGEEEIIFTPLEKNIKDKRYYLGITPEYLTRKYGVGESLRLAGRGFIEMSTQISGSFSQIVKGRVKKEEISGPIGIINIVGEASKMGMTTLIWLIAMLSINIGIFNLLPFPALDGGRIVFVILELFGIKINKKLEEKIHYGGILIILGLLVFITTNDFFNLTR